MRGLRRLNNGRWTKPPVLTAARKIIFDRLSCCFSTCSLGEAASFLNGTSYEVEKINELGNTPIIRISNITDPSSKYIRTIECLDGKFWVTTGDLLVSWSASFKTIIWEGPEGYLNQHIFKVNERVGFDRRYIRHAIEASFEQMQERVVGIGMMHLRRADFLGHHIPAPPIEIQKLVADYLDVIESNKTGEKPALPPELADQQGIVARIETLAAEIDHARTLRQQVAEEAEALVTSTLRGLTDAVEANGCLHDILACQPRNGWSAKCDNADGGIPVLSLSAVTGFKYRSNEYKRTSLYASENGHFWLKPGDLLITRSNTPELVGHAAIYDGSPEPCIYPDLMMRLDVKPESALKEFVLYWLMSPRIRAYITGAAKGTSPTMKKISQGIVSNTPFPTNLSIASQRCIVAELDELQAEVDRLKAFQAETAAEIDALLPAILDRAFKGELLQ